MKTKVDLSTLPHIEQPGQIHILSSKWYPALVQSLAQTCTKVLGDFGFTDVRQHTLPGSLEIPLAARDLLAEDRQNQIDALICFGVIVRGDTYHFEMIANEAMRGLGSVMHDFRRPVIVEILPVNDIVQAEERAADDEFNKGYEAAAAAIEMIAWRRQATKT